MTLTEKYKHLDVFKPYFILWLNLTYDEKGEPWSTRLLSDYLNEDDKVLIRKLILEQHKNLIEINHNTAFFYKNTVEINKILFNYLVTK